MIISIDKCPHFMKTITVLICVLCVYAHNAHPFIYRFKDSKYFIVHFQVQFFNFYNYTHTHTHTILIHEHTHIYTIINKRRNILFHHFLSEVEGLSEWLLYTYPAEVLKFLRELLPNNIKGETRPNAYEVSLEEFCTIVM